MDKIATEDRKIYFEFKPSENTGANATNAIDFTTFNRQVQSKKQNILGYVCDVVLYTPKTVDENVPMQLQKIAVYTSPLFSNTNVLTVLSLKRMQAWIVWWRKKS